MQWVQNTAELFFTLGFEFLLLRFKNFVGQVFKPVLKGLFRLLKKGKFFLCLLLLLAQGGFEP